MRKQTLFTLMCLVVLTFTLLTGCSKEKEIPTNPETIDDYIQYVDVNYDDLPSSFIPKIWLPEEKTDESFQKIFNELVKQYGEYEDYDSFPEGAGKEKYHILYAWAEIDGKWLSLFCDQDENGLVTNIILEWQYKMNIE